MLALAVALDLNILGTVVDINLVEDFQAHYYPCGVYGYTAQCARRGEGESLYGKDLRR